MSSEEPLEEPVPEVPPEPFVSLKGPQKYVVTRIVQQCRNQFGHLILHSPGSGKTLIALHLFLNLGPVLPKESPNTNFLEVNAFNESNSEAFRSRSFAELILEEDKRKRVVLLPAGIQDTFFENSRDLSYFRNSTKDSGGPSRMKSTYTIMTFKKAPSISRDFDTCLLNELGTGCSSVKTTLSEMFRDKIVIVDEAHNLLGYLRSKSRDKIFAAFRGAKRVILMTGTPILRFRSDLTLLMNLLDKSGRGLLFTDNDNVFDERYYELPLAQTIGQRVGRLLINNPAATSAILLQALGYDSNLVGYAILTEYASKFFAFFQNKGLRTFLSMPIKVVEKTLLESSFSPITKVNEILGAESDLKILNKTFEDLVRSKTSFFNYELDSVERLKYPVPQVIPIRVAYSLEQAKFLISLVKKTDRDVPLDEIYKKVPIGQGEDPVENVVDFVKFGLLLSNFCESAPPLNPLPFVKTPIQIDERKALYLIEEDLSANGISPTALLKTPGLETYVLRAFTPSEKTLQVVHECPKFRAMYAQLQCIRRNKDEQFSALVTFRKEVLDAAQQNAKTWAASKQINESLIRTIDDIKAAEKYYTAEGERLVKLIEQTKQEFLREKKSDLFKQYTIQKNKLSFIDAYLESLEAHDASKNPTQKPVTDPTRTYLPLVWSNFESSFEAFGAYLTSQGETYITIHRDDTPVQRLLSMKCCERSYPVAEGPKVVRKIGDTVKKTVYYSRPLCILLHPDVIEGLSFTYSPALLAMETIRGHGNREQVYARILRSFKESETTETLMTRPRAKKFIFQFQGDYSDSHVVNEGKPYDIDKLVLPDIFGSLETLPESLRFYAYNFISSTWISKTRTDPYASSPEEIQKLWNSKTAVIYSKLKDLYPNPDEDTKIGTKCVDEKKNSACRVCTTGFVGCNSLEDSRRGTCRMESLQEL